MNSFKLSLPLTHEPSDYFVKFIRECSIRSFPLIVQISDEKLKFELADSSKNVPFKRPSASISLSYIPADSVTLSSFASRFNMAMSIPKDKLTVILSLSIGEDENLVLPLEIACMLCVKIIPKTEETQKVLDLFFNITKKDNSLK